MSPLDDNAMYLKLAQAAAAKGNPPGMGDQTMPPAGPSANPGQTSPPPGPDPQMVMQAIKQIAPQLQPPQVQALMQLLGKIISSSESPAAEAAEPPQPGAM